MRHKRADLSGRTVYGLDCFYDFVLEYGRKPWKGLWLGPLAIFLVGLIIYRRSRMIFEGDTATAGPKPFYLSFVYTVSKMVPFYSIPELQGWRPRTKFGLVYLLLFPLAQVALAILVAHYTFEKV